MVGFGATVHFAPLMKYSCNNFLYGRVSKYLDRHAIGASMISLPMTTKLSRGHAMCNPEMLAHTNMSTPTILFSLSDSFTRKKLALSLKVVISLNRYCCVNTDVLKGSVVR